MSERKMTEKDHQKMKATDSYFEMQTVAYCIAGMILLVVLYAIFK